MSISLVSILCRKTNKLPLDQLEGNFSRRLIFPFFEVVKEQGLGIPAGATSLFHQPNVVPQALDVPFEVFDLFLGILHPSQEHLFYGSAVPLLIPWA